MLNVDHALAATTGNVLGQLLLLAQGLEGCLNDVHGVAGSPHLGTNIQNSNARADLVNVVVAAVTETYYEWDAKEALEYEAL